MTVRQLNGAGLYVTFRGGIVCTCCSSAFSCGCVTSPEEVSVCLSDSLSVCLSDNILSGFELPSCLRSGQMITMGANWV
jgi:hypothetical protein